MISALSRKCRLRRLGRANGTLTTAPAAVANRQDGTCWDAFSRGFLYAVNTVSSLDDVVVEKAFAKRLPWAGWTYSFAPERSP